MFGYIRADDPYLYKKDDVLYQAAYCGLCAEIGRLCGQAARLGLTYDVAFLSILLHNLANEDIKIEKRHCIAHPFRRKNIAVSDRVTRQMAALNTVLCYYKGLDDLADTGKKSLKYSLFSRGYRRAANEYPEIARLAEKCYRDLNAIEKEKCPSVDMAADAFSCLARDISVAVLGEKADENSGKCFYHLGKWIYLTDAADDFDKDVKTGNYNVFACAYPDCKSGEELLKKHGEEVFQIFNSVFYHLKQGLDGARFYFNKDLVENVLIRGIPAATDRVMKKYLDKKE